MTGPVKEAGHVFLARLGKKRLRPGGKTATNWLMAKAAPKAGEDVLEVACNQGTTLLELARLGCRTTGLDMDASALEKARANLAAAGFEKSVTLVKGDARRLPFPDGSFDLIVNEAMLTMLGPTSRKEALKEYFRVLRPGGRLATHDVALLEPDRQIGPELGRAINACVYPETAEEWKRQMEEAGFETVETELFEFSLMTPLGMLRDEGLFGTLKIRLRAAHPENREFFTQMKTYFDSNKEMLRAIAVVSRK